MPPTLIHFEICSNFIIFFSPVFFKLINKFFVRVFFKPGIQN
jgi:hypothetical protein